MLNAGLRLALVLLWILLCCLPVWLARAVGKNAWRDRVSIICYRGLLKIIGIRLTIVGEPAQERPLLLVSNHISYLDIIILGSCLPVRFTPKSDIASWPLVGWICRQCDAVFVDRRPDKVKEMRQALHAALSRGEIVSLFPEATTGNGVRLLPFKSGFFSLAEAEAESGLAVQPAAIAYTGLRRLPIDSTQWPLVAWYGDMNLLPHMIQLMRMAPIDARLVFLPCHAMSDRKRMAAGCHTAIAHALEKIRTEARTPSVPPRRLYGGIWQKFNIRRFYAWLHFRGRTRSEP